MEATKFRLLVNGRASELTLESERLSWRPLEPKSRASSQLRVSSTNLDSGRRISSKKSKYQVTGRPVAALDFNQLIGFKWTKPKKKEQNGAQEAQKHKPNQANERKSRRKLKIFYAKQSGKLLKLKRISIASLHQVKQANDGVKQKHDDNDDKQRAASDQNCDTNDAADDANDKPREILEHLAELLEQRLQPVLSRRPGRLLVFVNPFGGKGRAPEVYKRRVKKLFDLAQIESQLVTTEYANHARKVIEDPHFNVEFFDGIVCIGGDGMFSELMNGLLFRYNRNKLLQLELDKLNGRSNATMAADCGLLAHDRRRFESPAVPIGVIGAGSTDANLFGFIGTNDVVSAALNIILGGQISIDVCSVHSYADDKLLRFVSTFVAYGYFGDVVRRSEKFRWLGPSRYDLTAVNTLLKNRTYRGTVRMLCSRVHGTPHDLRNRCQLDCLECRSHANAGTKQVEEQQLEPDCEIVEESGAFVGVNAAVTACKCPQTRKGFSPGQHLANGCADLILVRPCTRLQYVNYLIRTGYTKKSAFDLDYVEAYRCKQFEFLAQPDDQSDDGEEKDEEEKTSRNMEVRGSSSSDMNSSSSKHSSLESKKSSHRTTTTDEMNADELSSSANHDVQRRQQRRSAKSGRRPRSSWNADGEILTEQSIRVKVNQRLLRVFGNQI